jgi:ATP-binding cassette subfamily B multidrug efflux pump
MTSPTGPDGQSGQSGQAGRTAPAEQIDRHDIRQRAAASRRTMGGNMGGAAMPTERSRNFKVTARRLAAQLGHEFPLLIAVVVFAVGSMALFVAGPRVLGHATDVIVDGLRDQRDGIDFGALHRTLLWAVGIYLASGLFAWCQAWILAGVLQRSMFRLRADVEDKIHRLPLPYVDGMPRGDLLSRVTNDIDNLAQTLQQTLSQLLTSILQMTFVLVMMLSISWVLTVFSLVTIPLTIFVIRVISSRSRARFGAQWHHTGVLNSQIEEAFTGHAIVKVFGRQQEVEARFDERNQKLFEATFWAQFLAGTVQPLAMFIGNLNLVTVAVVGGLRVASGTLTVGDIQAFIQYNRQFTQPQTQLAAMFNLMQSGVATAERIFELLDADEEPSDSHLPELATPRGRIAFEHVTFSYQPDRPLIEDLSFVAEPGQTVAIVGPTGAGKTTLVNLIMRFYDVQGGRITLDDRDITSVRRRELRQHFGMVLQDTWLFGGTIRENIAYGDPTATDDQILAAAKAAYVDRFVHSLPEGYDTVLDDQGTTVSAGEKQLLTIARAFLADPTILILDEATSSVDTRTEVLIQAAMTQLRSSRTSFVIAHRLSTIRDADTILVMEHGQIVEQGSHEDLLAAGGAFYNLYNAQFFGAAT